MEDTHPARALTRRQFSLAAAAVALSATTARGADAPTIDTHAHVFHNGLKRAADIRYSPDYDAKLDDYLRMLDANGMTHGVLVQPSFLGTDNSYIVECLGAAKGRVRAIAVVEPSVSADELKRLNDAGVVGLRLNLVGRPLPDLASPVWQAHLAAVAKLGWQVEVQRAGRSRRARAADSRQRREPRTRSFHIARSETGYRRSRFRRAAEARGVTPPLGENLRPLPQRPRGRKIRARGFWRIRRVCFGFR